MPESQLDSGSTAKDSSLNTTLDTTTQPTVQEATNRQASKRLFLGSGSPISNDEQVSGKKGRIF